MRFTTKFTGQDSLKIGLATETEIELDDPVLEDDVWVLKFRLVGAERTLEERVVAETPLMAMEFAVRMMRRHLEPEYLSKSET